MKADYLQSDSQEIAWSVVAQVIAWLVGLAVCVPVEWQRMQIVMESGAGFALWLTDWHIDTTFPLLLLLCAPVFRLIRGNGQDDPDSRPSLWATWFANARHPEHRTLRSTVIAWILCGVVGATSLLASMSIAGRTTNAPGKASFGSLPPAYHDEYSYLFQARTFLAGRMSFPSHATMPELFDQMHVLNEGRFASRYFPATGAWIAPFLAWDRPFVGHWIAGALTAIFIFWSARELSGNGIGFLAGMLTAASPGMGIFSNQLLAHHPALVGLSLFLYCFLRMMHSRSIFFAACAGVGLAFAMLARPMTAAGFALPFGVWLVGWLFRPSADSQSKSRTNRKSTPRARRFVIAAAIGAPLVLGFAVLGVYNRDVTGSALTTPYQVYTDTYTPRHVYGFNNRIRGEQRPGPKVIDHYDEWAENLTPALATQNVLSRLVASMRWTLGLVPVTMALLYLILNLERLSTRFRLTFAAIISLHVVHIPYWYDGIMHWHYVFETGPLLAIGVAVTTGMLFSTWSRNGRPAMAVWWCALLGGTILMNHFQAPPLWSQSRVSSAVNSVAFSRIRYAGFRRLLERRVTERPALVLVRHDPPDLHIDYVINNPALDDDILIGRYREGETDIRRVTAAFPDRTCYLFDARDGRIEKFDGSHNE